MDTGEEGRAVPVPVEPLELAEMAPDVLGGDVQVVLIDSTVIGAPVCFAFDDGWKSVMRSRFFFATELPFLRQMSQSELRRRYSEKLAFGAGWIRDRLEEPTKH
jgi:hypothetical protein